MQLKKKTAKQYKANSYALIFYYVICSFEAGVSTIECMRRSQENKWRSENHLHELVFCFHQVSTNKDQTQAIGMAASGLPAESSN